MANRNYIESNIGSMATHELREYTKAFDIEFGNWKEVQPETRKTFEWFLLERGLILGGEILTHAGKEYYCHSKVNTYQSQSLHEAYRQYSGLRLLHDRRQFAEAHALPEKEASPQYDPNEF